MLSIHCNIKTVNIQNKSDADEYVFSIWRLLSVYSMYDSSVMLKTIDSVEFPIARSE